MQPKTPYRIRINHFIKVPQVRVLDSSGTAFGILNTYEALNLAKEQGLDLVEISPKSIPPVCKIIDFGKYKYEAKKQEVAAKKNQKVVELKEVVLKPATDENDLKHKLNAAKEFLADGNRVKFTIRFRGREISHPEIGHDKMTWILNEISSLISSAMPITMAGKLMTTIVNPKNH